MKGIVYQIYLESNPYINYVGSTIKTLEIRWRQHKAKSVIYNKTKIKGNPIICQYFDEFGIDNFKIRLIKEYDIVDIKHIRAYEQLWLNKLKPINVIKNLFLTKHLIRGYSKIYYENNREQFRERSKTYSENNREHLIEYRKNYIENHREQIKESTKAYYKNNREHLIEYQKTYRENHRELYTCPCSPNKQITQSNKLRHEKSLKHQKYLQSLEETKE